MKPTELVVISGKGGTGKTSLVAAFATLAAECVLADCDVDASNLHLIHHSELVLREPFSGRVRASIDPDRCTDCGICETLCRFDAIQPSGGNGFTPVFHPTINPHLCEGCGVCAWFCPEKAIDLYDGEDGHVLLSKTRCGPMAHARLGVAGENSGKLVGLVREQARELAVMRELDTILIDGSPGIGCPVIASLTGADMALIVTEPSVSGVHDMKRIAELAAGFGIPTLVAVNRWDVNPQLTDEIESLAVKHGLEFAGRVRYDTAFSRAQLEGKSVLDIESNDLADDIKQVWSVVEARLHN